MRLPKTLICAILLLTPMISKPLAAQTIHVLMFADTANRTTGSGVRASVSQVRTAFASLVPKNRYTFTSVESHTTRFTAASLYQQIRRLPVGPNDTFVFVASLKGGSVGQRQFLQMPNGGKVWSKMLRTRIKAKRCPLKLIITDTCDLALRPTEAASSHPGGWDPKTKGMAPVIKELFVEQTGILQMNSSWPGQQTFVNSQTGSWFLGELFGYCLNNPMATPDWDFIDKTMDKTMTARFLAAKAAGKLPAQVAEQKTLVPYTLETPKPL